CCCQSSARSSRKRLLNARRVASGEPPGFPENPLANLPLMRPLITFGAGLCSGLGSIFFAWFSGARGIWFQASLVQALAVVLCCRFVFWLDDWTATPVMV